MAVFLSSDSAEQTEVERTMSRQRMLDSLSLLEDLSPLPVAGLPEQNGADRTEVRLSMLRLAVIASNASTSSSSSSSAGQSPDDDVARSYSIWSGSWYEPVQRTLQSLTGLSPVTSASPTTPGLDLAGAIDSAIDIFASASQRHIGDLTRRSSRVPRGSGLPSEGCRFCKNNGVRYEDYMSHQIRDAEMHVTCPVLFKYVCPYCGATGSKAHTKKYCPKNRSPEAIQAQRACQANMGLRRHTPSPTDLGWYGPIGPSSNDPDPFVTRPGGRSQRTSLSSAMGLDRSHRRPSSADLLDAEMPENFGRRSYQFDSH